MNRPETLTAFVRSAIKDSLKIERNYYVPDADRWHRYLPEISFSCKAEIGISGIGPFGGKIIERPAHCRVCLAGAWLASTGFSKTGCIETPCDAPDAEMETLLRTLESIRCGFWVEAINEYYGDGHPLLGSPDPPSDTRMDLDGIARPALYNFASWDKYELFCASVLQRMGQLEALGF